MKKFDVNLKSFMYLFAILTLSTFLFSCSSKPENAIAGKWQEINGTEQTEFFKNGTVNSVDRGVNLKGNFKFIDKDHIQLEMAAPGAPVMPLTAQVTIADQVLTLTMANGKILKYKKTS